MYVHIYTNTTKIISLVVNIWAGMGITDHINVDNSMLSCFIFASIVVNISIRMFFSYCVRGVCVCVLVITLNIYIIYKYIIYIYIIYIYI